MKQFFNSQKYRRLIIWTGVIILLLLSFQGGVFVGFHKASMGFMVDQRYERAYGNHIKSGPFGIPNDDFPEAHGAIGRVLSVHLPTIIVEDKNTEKIVRIAPDTIIRKNRVKISEAQITTSDFVVVIGEPNDQQEINAKFIRMIPPPAGYVGKSTSTQYSTTTSQ